MAEAKGPEALSALLKNAAQHRYIPFLFVSRVHYVPIAMFLSLCVLECLRASLCLMSFFLLNLCERLCAMWFCACVFVSHSFLAHLIHDKCIRETSRQWEPQTDRERQIIETLEEDIRLSAELCKVCQMEREDPHANRYYIYIYLQ